MKEAQDNRSFRETQFNERSSRSHCVMQVWLDLDEPSGTGTEGSSSCLSFIDLAGSERVNAIQTDHPDQVKETVHINRSLSSLGTCVQALATSAKYIPYRDTKLTHLMSDALGGRSKTLFLITLSTDPRDTVQTIASLRFGSGLSGIQRGRPVQKLPAANRSRVRSTSRL
eukprot:CRZ05483.1 hypothetical protein [Spongospora subterranea]